MQHNSTTPHTKRKRRTLTVSTKIDSLEADRLLPRLTNIRARGRRDIGMIVVRFVIVRGAMREECSR